MPEDPKSPQDPSPDTQQDTPTGGAGTATAQQQPSQQIGAQTLVPAAQAALAAKAPTWLVVLREVTTTFIAIVIVIVSMRMVWLTFNESVDPAFQRMKDILLLALPLLGTILGYYFGRVPAERRAEASEQKASAAQQTAQSATDHAVQTQQQTTEKLHNVKVAVERAKAKLEGGSAGGPPSGGGQTRGGVLGGPSIASAGGDDAQSASTGAWSELDSVSKML